MGALNEREVSVGFTRSIAWLCRLRNNDRRSEGFYLTSPEARLTASLSDRYRLERELGQGGMATVYLAEDLKHGRKVAIKMLHPELSAVIGGERFLTEIKTTASLQHPHILGLIDSGDADGLLYYVMPFIEGETLRGRLIREKQLPVDDAVRLTREVASALEFAHKRGIVHRPRTFSCRMARPSWPTSGSRWRCSRPVGLA
jgi:serine/threonine protein kinase